MSFNETINKIDWIELPLKGRKYTWSNMQQSPLMEKLDVNFPNSEAFPLAKTTSDYIPYVIKIGTKIPKCHIFRFQNSWMTKPGFDQVVTMLGNNINTFRIVQKELLPD